MLVEELPQRRATTVRWSQTIGWAASARRAWPAASAQEQAGVALLARQAEVRAAVTSAFFALLGARSRCG